MLVILAFNLTLTRWVMASVKKTRSRIEPLTFSLCWVWYIISFSDKNSKFGTWKNVSWLRWWWQLFTSRAKTSNNCTKFIPVHKFWGHQNRHHHPLLQWAQERLAGSPQSMVQDEALRQGWGQHALESNDSQPSQTTLCPQSKQTYCKTMYQFCQVLPFLLYLKWFFQYLSSVPVSNHPCAFTHEKSQQSGDIITLVCLNV